jgi:hypothetical protein
MREKGFLTVLQLRREAVHADEAQPNVAGDIVESCRFQDNVILLSVI